MIDLVIALLLILFAVLGWRRGLIRSLAELAGMLAALLLANQIAAAGAEAIVDRALRPATHEAIRAQVVELAEERGPDFSACASLASVVEAIPNGLIRERARDVLEGLDQAAAQALVPTRDRLAQAGEEIADAVLDGPVFALIRSILCGVCFVLLTILLRLAARVLCLAEKLPGIRQLNELGGALLGAAKGLLLVCLGVWILRQTGVMPEEAARASAALGLMPRWISLL